MKMKIFLFIFSILLIFTFNSNAEFPNPPVNINGSVIVDGFKVSWITDEGYIFEVTREDGSSFTPVASDEDGLNKSNLYSIQVPTGNSGSKMGDIVVLHVYKDGKELEITSPSKGKFKIEGSGSCQNIHIIVGKSIIPQQYRIEISDINEMYNVNLDASRSYYYGDTDISLKWEQISGTPVTLSDDTAISTSFVVPGKILDTSILIFKLTIKDIFGSEFTDTFYVSKSYSKARSITSGLPFTENFSTSTFQDKVLTMANWSINDGALILNTWQKRFDAFSPETTVSKYISSDISKTYVIVKGDIDGDGDEDIIAGNRQEPNILYLNNGTADPFKNVTGKVITNDSLYTLSMDLGDVDGDGDIDLVTGEGYNSNQLYLNNGTADPFNNLLKGIDISTENKLTCSIVLKDIDGDGDLDVIEGNANDKNRLFLNNGSSNPFEDVTGKDITEDIHLTFSISIADVDNDNDLDIIAGNSNQINRLYLNNGTSDPFNGVSGEDISLDINDTNDIKSGDMNSDGFIDIVAGNYNQPNRLYLNNGTSHPYSGVEGINITEDIQNTLSIALEDIDFDGDLDFVAGNEGINRLYLNNGTSTPFLDASKIDFSNDNHATYSLVLADFDKDGDLDLVAGNESSVNKLYINNSSSIGGIEISNDSDSSKAIAFGDFNNDGFPDLVVANNGLNRIYINNGTSTPFKGVDAINLTSDIHMSFAVATGDVDNDGDIDIVIGNYGEKNRLYQNTGTEIPFTQDTSSDIGSATEETLAVILSDMNNDGYLDLIIGNDGINRLYINNGTIHPFFGVSGKAITYDDYYTTSIAVGDLNNDGHPDFIAGNCGYWSENLLYLNNGTSDPFKDIDEGIFISEDLDETYAIGMADFNGDGNIDVITGNLKTQNKLYLNNGTSLPFDGVEGIYIGTLQLSTESLSIGDIDNDGDIDFVTGNWKEKNQLYLNNGTSNPFLNVSGIEINSESHQTKVVGLYDIDSDGDLDLIEANDNQTNLYFLNNGNASSFINSGDGSEIPSGVRYLSQGYASSLQIDNIDSGNIPSVTLTSNQSLNPNTWINYYLSNNGGDNFFRVYPGKVFVFPTTGDDLRWKAELNSLSPLYSPRVNEIQITRDCIIISEIPNQKIPKSTISEPIAFTLTDYIGVPEIITSSSNTMLIPDDNINVQCNLGNCSLTVSPYPGISGNTFITVSASDGCRTVKSIFSIEVYNSSPVTEPIEVIIKDNKPHEINITCNDNDGDELNYVLNTPPQHGSVSGTPPLITYTPHFVSFEGIDTFSYKVSDGSDYNILVITARINCIEIICQPSSLTLDEDTFKEGLLTCSGTQSLHYFIVNNPEKGSSSIINESEGRFKYIADSDKFGDDTFTFYATNNTVNSKVVPVTVTILPVNDAPYFTKGPDIEVSSHEQIKTFNNWASQINPGNEYENNQILEFHVSVDNDLLFKELPVISSNGTLTFTPALNAEGTVNVNVFIKDNGGVDSGGIDQSITQSFKIKFSKVFNYLHLNSPWQGEALVNGLQYYNVSYSQRVLPQWDARFDINSDVSIEVVPDEGWKFVSWAGDISGTINPMIIKMDSNKSISAKFVQVFTLDITKSGEGQVKINGIVHDLPFSCDYEKDAIIMIESIPKKPDWIFGSWSGDVNNTNSNFVIKMDTNKNITASFDYLLNLSINGCGKIKINEDTYELPAQKTIVRGTNVTIEAMPAEQFSDWSGDIQSTTNPLSFNMLTDKQITLNLLSNDIVLKKGWNLISLPANANDMSLKALFPDAEVAYEFIAGSYILTDILKTQKGYFVKMPFDKTYNIQGIFVIEYTKTLSPGWYLIGATSDSTTIQTIPENSIEAIYKYSMGAYYEVESLEPGIGYWIKVKNECVINLGN